MNKLSTARKERLSTIVDMVVYKSKKADRRKEGSSSDSEGSEAHQDDSECTESSDSDSGSEELDMPGRGEEPQFIRMVAGDSTDEVFFEEEPFEVAISTNAVLQVMPELGKEEDRHCRTVNSFITWKEETCKK